MWTLFTIYTLKVSLAIPSYDQPQGARLLSSQPQAISATSQL